MKWKFGKFEFKGKKLFANFGSVNGKRVEMDWDVDEIGDYVDEQSEELIADLINEGNTKALVNVMTNVKGKELIKLITSSPTLQAASTCGWTASGGMVLTDKTISTVRVKIQEEYCNEDLNETWAQMMNAIGANAQDETPPTFADAMLLYYQMRAQELDEDLMWNGDTDSLDTNLDHYDGYVKNFDADTDFNIANFGVTEVDDTNGFDALKAVFNAMPTVVKRHKDKIKAEIVCGYEMARHAIEQRDNDKDYGGTVEYTEADGVITFTLPTTNVTVRSIQQLDGTQKVYGLCWGYMFYATDLEDDKSGFTWKYSDYDEQLRFGVKWRTGVAHVLGQYFTRLRLTPES